MYYVYLIYQTAVLSFLLQWNSWDSLRYLKEPKRKFQNTCTRLTVFLFVSAVLFLVKEALNVFSDMSEVISGKLQAIIWNFLTAACNFFGGSGGVGWGVRVWGWCLPTNHKKKIITAYVLQMSLLRKGRFCGLCSICPTSYHTQCNFPYFSTFWAGGIFPYQTYPTGPNNSKIYMSGKESISFFSSLIFLLK